VSPFE